MQAKAEIIEMTLKRPFRIATGERRVQPNVFLTLSAGGDEGLGEAPLAGFDAGGPAALLADVAGADRRTAALDEAAGADLGGWIAAAAGDLPAASGLRCALESALCDLFARRLGRPLHEVLGLRAGPLPTSSFTLGIDSPEVIREKLEEAGDLPVLKIKLGSEHDETVLPLVRRSTQAVLRVDANGGWSPRTAPDRLRLCADCGVEFVEQPLPPGMIEETARLAAAAPCPIVLDEDCRTADDVALLAGKVHGVNVKLRKAGGVWSALEVLRAARAAGLKTMIGCFIESSLGITAAAHLGTLADWLDLDGHVLVRDDPFQGAEWDRGRLTLPAGPGLGVRRRSRGVMNKG